jgi:isoquinoline 1-oxidoreductase beta subunit
VGPTKFAVEAFLDEIATRRSLDPIALRLELLTNQPRARAVVEEVARMAEWNKPRPAGRALGFAYIDYTGSQLGGIAEVSLDKKSGVIRVHKFWCTIDCGIAIQPDNVIAQTEGSIVYGLGLALTERITFKDGAIEQSNFNNYPVPRMRDVPEMFVKVMPTDNHPTGAGQMSTPLVAPAIAAAVYKLTGARLRHLPMTPEKVKLALLEVDRKLA